MISKRVVNRRAASSWVASLCLTFAFSTTAHAQPEPPAETPAEREQVGADKPDADQPDVDKPDANAPDADEPNADQPGADESDKPAPTPPTAEKSAAPTEPEPAPIAPPVPYQAAPGVDGAEGSDEDLSAGLDDVSLVELLKLDLRVATTKTNTTIAASPASVTVIPREQIERYGYRSVAEALRDVVGTYVVDDHITPNLGMRGVPGAAFEGSGAVKVMIDGVPVSFRTTGENWLGPALIPMASVERIEIVKGPTSSLYGADAFLGVINVITKEAGQKSWGEVGALGMMSYQGKPGGHAEAAGGVVARPFRFTFGGQFDEENLSGLTMPSSSPSPAFAETAQAETRGQIKRSGVGIFTLSYQPNRKTEVSLATRYSRQHAAAEYAPWLQFTTVPGAHTGTWLSMHQASTTLKAGSSFTRDFRMEATATGFFGSTLPDDRIETGDSMAVVHRELSYFGGEGIVEAIWQPIEPLRMVLGVEGSADREHLGAPDYRARDDGSSLPTAGNAQDFDTTLFNVAGRGQLTWEIIEHYLVPTGGIRVDYNSVYGSKLSGRAALVSRLVPELYVKAAYGNAFKAPTPLLLYGRPLTTGDVIGSPEVGAQQFRSLEFTIDYRPQAVADFEVTVSRWNLLDRAAFRPEQINLIARNAADANGITVEAQMTSRFSEVVGGSLGFEWTRAQQESGETGYRGELFGTAQAIYPDWITRARLWVAPRPLPLEVWAATNVVGPRKASESNTLEAGERYVLSTYATLDAGVRTLDLRFWGDRLTELSLRAHNLAGTAGTRAGYFGIDYPAAPPRVLLELRQEL